MLERVDVFLVNVVMKGLSQGPRGLRRESAAARLLGLGGSNPAGSIDVCLLWVLCVVR